MAGTTEQKQWIAAGVYDELPVGTGKTVRYEALEIALFRLASGQVKAIQNRCPHKNGVLAEGIVCDDHVFCPMHDRKIHIPSGLVQAPDTGCVAVYDVKVEAGTVYIALPKPEEMAS